MATLYHFTSKRQLQGILSTGELFMTPNQHLSMPGQVFPVLWLSSDSGEGRAGNTVAAALNLDQAVQGQHVNRTEIRFTVEVPDEEVRSWDDYAAEFGVSPTVMRRLQKWPKHPEWWIPFERSIPSDEWVEISQGGQGAWVPVFTPDSPVCSCALCTDAGYNDEADAWDWDVTPLPVISGEHAGLVQSIADFYGLPGCGVGGPLHITLDDGNVEDHCLDFCREEIEKGWRVDDMSDEDVTEVASTGIVILDQLQAIPRLAVRGAVIGAAHRQA